VNLRKDHSHESNPKPWNFRGLARSFGVRPDLRYGIPGGVSFALLQTALELCAAL
jgi:hypothetical protein